MKSSPEEPTGTYENPPYIDLADVRAVNPVADLSHVAIDGVLLDDQFAPQDKESEGVSIAEFNHIADAYPIAQKAQYDAMVPQPGRASWWTLNEAYEIDSIGFAAGFSPRSIRKEPFRYRSTVAYRVGENNDNSLLAADFTLRRKKDFTPDFISLGFESGDNLNCIQTTLHSNDVYQVKPKSRLSVKREALDANNGPSKVDEITAKVQRETGLNLAGRDWLEIRFGDKPQFSFFNRVVQACTKRLVQWKEPKRLHLFLTRKL